MDNFSYLFWAYAIFWIALFIYIYGLLERNRKLRKEMEALRYKIQDARYKMHDAR